jgi:beta-lactamase class A
MLPGTTLNCDLHPHNHAPMQSMYKLPLALTALHMADVGTLLPTQRVGEPMDVTLDRTVQFLPTDIIPGSFSPLTERYPEANVDVKLREIINLAVGQSDTGAEEILVRLVGGPLVVEHYLHLLGISAIQVRYSEPPLQTPLSFEQWTRRLRRVDSAPDFLRGPPCS